MQHTLKIIASVAAVIFIVSWFAHGIMINTYVNYPRQPQQEMNNVIPYSVKGVVVYISEDDRGLLPYLKWCELISGSITGLFVLLHTISNRHIGK